MNYAVIGTGFGDEGKGKVVSTLCQDLEDTIVVRFSGGQQAGHGVYPDKDSTERHHVFSNFGSGTFINAATYWSEYCTFDPVGFINEYNILKDKFHIEPVFYINENCPITTPYDKYKNQTDLFNLNHGTCGTGVGATWQREEDLYSLRVMDLFYDSIFNQKLNSVEQYYKNYDIDESVSKFLAAIKIIKRRHLITRTNDNIINTYKNVVFEGSQGLMLDPDIGFFPHVTRSSIGLKNVYKILDKTQGESAKEELNVYLLSRAYQTRHGNGPMTNMTHPKFNPGYNKHEINETNKYQREFRSSLFDLDMFQYAIRKHILQLGKQFRHNTVFTCTDHIKDENYEFIYNNKIYNGYDRLYSKILDFSYSDNIWISDSPFPGLKKIHG